MRAVKQICIGLGIVGVSLVGPVMLAKMGYYQDSVAAEQKFRAARPLPANTLSFRAAVEVAAPAVVSVHTKHEIQPQMHPFMNDPFFRHFFGQQLPQGGQLPKESRPGLGSGVIVNEDGYVLTNNHVIKDADEILIKLQDGREAEAKVVGMDADSDLAVLKIELEDLPTIPIGNSEDNSVGDIVLAIGNPFGVGQTVTMGIIGATHRQEIGLNVFENFIQTDASINPGNSGGALVDVAGNLIGINAAIATQTGANHGIGFAIPIETAKDVMVQLIQHGHVTRGWLGISIRKLTPELKEQLKYDGDGAVIAGVQRGGPAHKAGILPGDIVVGINGKKTPDHTALQRETMTLEPEKAYNIEIYRDGEIYDFRVVIGKRPTEQKPQ